MMIDRIANAIMHIYFTLAYTSLNSIIAHIIYKYKYIYYAFEIVIVKSSIKRDFFFPAEMKGFGLISDHLISNFNWNKVK